MDELEILSNTPVLFTPSKSIVTIQNTMPSSDDKLYASTHGDLNKKRDAINIWYITNTETLGNLTDWSDLVMFLIKLEEI